MMAGNGLGPKWLPKPLRAALTKLGSVFFDEASWATHDTGYYLGSPSRADCDRGFLKAMLRDASLSNSTFKILSCCVLAWVIWLFVRALGWLSYGVRV